MADLETIQKHHDAIVISDKIWHAERAHEKLIDEESLEMAGILADQECFTPDGDLFLLATFGSHRSDKDVVEKLERVETKFGKAAIGQPIALLEDAGSNIRPILLRGKTSPCARIVTIGYVPDPHDGDSYHFAPSSPLRYQFRRTEHGAIVSNIILPVVLQHEWQFDGPSNQQKLIVHPEANISLYGGTRSLYLGATGGDYTGGFRVGYEQIAQAQEFGKDWQAKYDLEFLNRLTLARTAFAGYRMNQADLE